MRAIPVIRHSDGAVVARTWVDDEDFAYLSQWTWRLSGGYAKRTEAGKTLGLHNLVAERAGMDMSKEIDHISRIQLDNRRSNLRPATRQEQNRNQGKSKNNKSGVKGVSWNKNTNRWRATIRINGRQLHLGLFDDLENAARAREAAELKHFKHPKPLK
jgi:hypothetical protein